MEQGEEDARATVPLCSAVGAVHLYREAGGEDVLKDLATVGLWSRFWIYQQSLLLV